MHSVCTSLGASLLQSAFVVYFVQRIRQRGPSMPTTVDEWNACAEYKFSCQTELAERRKKSALWFLSRFENSSFLFVLVADGRRLGTCQRWQMETHRPTKRYSVALGSRRGKNTPRVSSTQTTTTTLGASPSPNPHPKLGWYTMGRLRSLYPAKQPVGRCFPSTNAGRLPYAERIGVQEYLPNRTVIRSTVPFRDGRTCKAQYRCLQDGNLLMPRLFSGNEVDNMLIFSVLYIRDQIRYLAPTNNSLFFKCIRPNGSPFIFSRPVLILSWT